MPWLSSYAPVRSPSVAAAAGILLASLAASAAYGQFLTIPDDPPPPIKSPINPITPPPIVLPPLGLAPQSSAPSVLTSPNQAPSLGVQGGAKTSGQVGGATAEAIEIQNRLARTRHWALSNLGILAKMGRLSL